MSDPVFLGDADMICDLSSPKWRHLISDDQPAKPKHKPRRPSLDKEVKRALAAGLDVRSANVTADGVLLTFGEAEAPAPLDAEDIETPEQIRKLI